MTNTDRTDTPLPTSERFGLARLVAIILANGFLRVAGGAGGILVGLYLSDAARKGSPVDAAVVGVIGAVSFGAELVASVPMGILSDAIAPKWLMVCGAVLNAASTQLFGLTGRTGVFLASRGLEGVGAASVGPALLAHLTDVSDGRPSLRARVMSFYELSFLGGIAIGSLVGSQLWRSLHTRAFGAVAGLYLLCAVLFYFGGEGSKAYGGTAALTGFSRAMCDPYLRRLAPVWLCVNTIVGLWLGPTLTFLFTQSPREGQFLAGVFAGRPEQIGWVMLWYAVVFGIGVTVWSFVLPRIGSVRSLRIGLLAMPLVCFGLYALNHSGGSSADVRWTIGSITAILIMIESGFTPAALSLLAAAMGAHAGRGSAMGVYSVLLSIGAIAGSLLAAGLGQRFSVDGLIYGTFGLGLFALVMAGQLTRERST